MLALMAVGEVRPGYELWRPNREKASTHTTRAIMVLLLLATAGLCLVITIGGLELLQGGIGMAFICFIYVALYVIFAFMTLSRRRAGSRATRTALRRRCSRTPCSGRC
jgi:uncharacterized membrane protein SirB2